MGITFYEPSPSHPDEDRRERAVEQSGALLAIGDPVLGSLVHEARAALSTAMAAVTILHRDWQYIIAGAGIICGPYSRRTSFCGHAIARPERVFIVPDATNDPRFAGNPSVCEENTLRFYAGASLVDDEGLPLGMLCVFDPAPRAGLAMAERARLIAFADAAMRRLVALDCGPGLAINEPSSGRVGLLA